MALVFLMVGKDDKPIYQLELAEPNKTQRGTSGEHLTQFVLHSALDVVEEAQWAKSLTYLGEVDSYKQLKVHTFVSAGYVKFMLLHSGKSDDSIKALFLDVHELYLKVLMNPFYAVNSPITSEVFDLRVRTAVSRRIG
eukprot:TRINITY_DN3907_c0_g1_i2.p1 TRINITY_DN3907_c0_g1~~TRINITY_DN3907_c0_g1_i2.p1  ORF type:complete len:138 (+),score=27.85 TRINITY_DN3907_c0_g1_i2:46-459(+)